MNRAITALVSLSLVAFALAALPSAAAAADTCTAVDDDCAGFVCIDENGDRRWSESECTTKRDLDTCQFQSDCCGGIGFPTFWCPEPE